MPGGRKAAPGAADKEDNMYGLRQTLLLALLLGMMGGVCGECSL